MVMTYSPDSGSSPDQSLTPSASSIVPEGDWTVKLVFLPVARWTLIVWPALARRLYSCDVQSRTVSFMTVVVRPRANLIVFDIVWSAWRHCDVTGMRVVA